jgi:hypothetical protein
MSIFNNNLLAGAAAQSTTTPVHTINQSIRFNNTGSNSTSHYFSKTFSSAGNQKTWTLSWWMKVGVGTDRRSLFSRRVGTAGAQAFRIRLLEDSEMVLVLIHKLILINLETQQLGIIVL